VVVMLDKKSPGPREFGKDQIPNDKLLPKNMECRLDLEQFAGGKSSFPFNAAERSKQVPPQLQMVPIDPPEKGVFQFVDSKVIYFIRGIRLDSQKMVLFRPEQLSDLIKKNGNVLAAFIKRALPAVFHKYGRLLHRFSRTIFAEGRPI